jgi:hypothetical protein
MPHRTIGTCSICGGAVVTPDVWLGVVPPTPECSSCGAQPRRSHGPVIEMRPSRIDLTPTQRARLLAKDSDAALWDFVNRGKLPPD